MAKPLSRTQIIKGVKELVTTWTKFEGDSYLNDDIQAIEYTAIRHARDAARLAQQLLDDEL